jgi:LysR family transcriptional regulator, nitrogen assimilation regulatory protein
MDLKQLEYFLKVAELGSFTRAAQFLQIAQPALSRQVQQLENELKQQLLIRNGRGALPTEAGRVLVDYGRGILYQVERAKEEVGRVGGSLAAKVAIGLPTSIAKVLTVPITKRFKAKLPQASLAVTEGLTTSLQESLISGRIDIALLYNPSKENGVHFAPLLFEELYLVTKYKSGEFDKSRAKHEKSISLAQIAKERLIIPTRPNAIRMLVEGELGAIGLSPKIDIEIDGISAILDLVADGLGSAVLPLNAILTASKPKHYVTQRIRGLKSQLVIATSALRPATLTQIAMQELVKELANELLVPR